MSPDSTHIKRPHFFYVALLALLTLWMSLPGLSSIPEIDRDEARYAQATVQMVESGDYLNIKFQDHARNKKPAGIYWMQAASVKTFTDPGERRIWAHRLPSTLAAFIAVLATYWGGITVLGRKGAFFAAAILATSALFVFESHIAKTDAMLCAMSAVVLACLLRLRRGPYAAAAILLWAAIGAGLMIKGPIIPTLLILTLVTLAIWERNNGWMKTLMSWPGMIVCAFLVVPWMIMIGLETNGAFFSDAIGGDLAPKLAGGQETHGAPPGYYLAALPLLFWPGSLFLICAIVFGVKAARQPAADTNAMSPAMRLLLAWTVPFWVLLEIVPTKLPNYILPIFPALALLCAGALMALLQVKVFGISRKIGAVLFLLVSIFLTTLIMSADAALTNEPGIAIWFTVPLLILAFITTGLLWAGHAFRALVLGFAVTAILTPLTYQIVFPRMETVFISRRVEKALENAAIKLPRKNGPRILSPHFTEPSLVYRLGTDIVLGDTTDPFLGEKLTGGEVVLINSANAAGKTFLQRLKIDQCVDEIDKIKGLNYSNGDQVEIVILQSKVCEAEPNAPEEPL